MGFSLQVGGELGHGFEVGEVMLDYQAGTGILDDFVDALHGGQSVGAVEIEVGNTMVDVVVAQMVEVAREDHRSGLLQLELEHLMPGRMAWRSEDADSAVAKDIEVAIAHVGFCALVAAEGRRNDAIWSRVA